MSTNKTSEQNLFASIADVPSKSTTKITAAPAVANDFVESGSTSMQGALDVKKNQLQESYDELDRLIEIMQSDTLYGESLEETRQLFVEDRINAKLDQKTQIIVTLMAKRLSVPKQEQQEVLRVTLR
ncbi:hypothetical protein OURE66S_01913 [Oligella ureolytica]